MLKKIYLFLIIFLFFFTSVLAETKIYIYATVDNEIITNYDVKKESEYLKILNPNLGQIDEIKNLDLAKQSLINEIIKKKEIEKFINTEEENPFVDDHMKNLISKLNYKDQSELEKDLLLKNNYTIDQIKKKIKLELLWNELIYKKYNNQIKIDKKALLNKINKLSDKTQKEYFISEILFNKKNQDLNEYVDQIVLSINEIGFNNTANIYSISESAKLGGKLGWINENSLADNIIEKLNLIKEGEFTEPMKFGNNYLILKIEKIKFNAIQVDKKVELEKLIKFETNKQLNQFSRIYFDKSKINYSINEN